MTLAQRAEAAGLRSAAVADLDRCINFFAWGDWNKHNDFKIRVVIEGANASTAKAKKKPMGASACEVQWAKDAPVWALTHRNLVQSRW